MKKEMFEKKVMRLLAVTRTMDSIKRGIEGGLHGMLHAQEMTLNGKMDDRLIRAISQATREAIAKYSEEMCAAIGTEIAAGCAEIMSEILVDQVIEMYESPVMQEYLDISPALFEAVIPKTEEINIMFVPKINEYVSRRIDELMA
ncbi:hypothetical protein LCGC14_0317870 [marine sediment metagenome]|uniref:Uncharacterized protein n=1 Tax=marine sediment metagenome TaxID=412755 RepID=A0A0F9WRX9_9ZZZZ